MSEHTPTRFSDDQARAILARAIEIDARAPMTTTEELRAIAAEIGVSTDALEAALREQTTSLEAQRRDTAARTATRIAALGVPVGAAAGLLATTGAVLPALGAMGAGLVVSGGLALFQSQAGSLRTFHIKNLACWSGAFAASLASMALFGDGVERAHALVSMGWCLRSWIASSIFGSVTMIAVRRSRRPENGDSDSGLLPSAEVATHSHWARVRRRIVDMLGLPSRRGSEVVRRAALQS